MTDFFTADLHLSHKRILEFCPTSRPCSSIEEHDELIIENWNEQVTDSDTVHVLGDVSWAKYDHTIELLTRLKGHKNLILGNHDKCITGSEFRNLFEDIRAYREIKVDGIDVVMMHYPILEWNKAHHGSVHLFGHVHGKKMNMSGRCMDVGIDSRTDMRLWSWEEIWAKLKDVEPLEHH